MPKMEMEDGNKQKQSKPAGLKIQPKDCPKK